MTKNKLVCGVGINDADYAVRVKVNGRRTMCPFYQTWANMLQRCYSNVFLSKHPTYNDCHVCDEWHTFSNFKSWMQKQDWIGKELDKDLLFYGNKIYSPETCVFVDKIVNAFMIDRMCFRGEFPLGVFLHKETGKYRARCKNPFSGKSDHLGLFCKTDEAHMAWKIRKLYFAKELARLQENQIVAKALLRRYSLEQEFK